MMNQQREPVTGGRITIHKSSLCPDSRLIVERRGDSIAFTASKVGLLEEGWNYKSIIDSYRLVIDFVRADDSSEALMTVYRLAGDGRSEITRRGLGRGELARLSALEGGDVEYFGEAVNIAFATGSQVVIPPHAACDRKVSPMTADAVAKFLRTMERGRVAGNRAGTESKL
jgi:hypothetical protein